MEWHDYRIRFTRHAFDQASKRGIHPNKIEETIRNGAVTRLGKHGVKFMTKRTIAVCRVTGDMLLVLTVERREGRR